MAQAVVGTIITRKGIRYFTKSQIQAGDKYVYARRIIKIGLSKKITKVWLKGSSLKWGIFKPKAK